MICSESTLKFLDYFSRKNLTDYQRIALDSYAFNPVVSRDLYSVVDSSSQVVDQDGVSGFISCDVAVKLCLVACKKCNVNV